MNDEKLSKVIDLCDSIEDKIDKLIIILLNLEDKDGECRK